MARPHKYMLEIEKLSAISDEMRAAVESEWPEQCTSCRRSDRYALWAVRAGRSVRDAKHVAGVEDYQVALATCCQVRVSQSV